MKTLQQWQDAVVYITGGSSGIGYSFAEHLCGVARTIVLLARRNTLLNEAAKKLQSLISQRAHIPTAIFFYSLDISSFKACKQTLLNVVAHHDAPTLLINSAGTVTPAYFTEIPDAVFNRMLTTNLMGNWHVIQTLLPRMPQGASIINVASFAGLLGIFGYSAYSASKYALVGLSEALRNEYARRIHISVLCPSDTDTPQLAEENKLKPPETTAVAGTIRPLHPSYVARYALRKAASGRFLIIPGLYPRVVWLLKRLLPSLLYKIIDQSVTRATQH